ncbi:MAG TPA: methyltransferase domain-containing protein [Bryobacteraceae bacterium]|nr:methyltransferase domain-containing protein [Bryobacteraceae bacterium]
MRIPGTVEELRQAADDFESELHALKSGVVVPDYGWYPYSSLSALSLLADLSGDVYGDLVDSLRSESVADIGCGDGDLAVFFARCGCRVDAIDHAETNYNQLRGVEALRRSLGVVAGIYDIDFNGRFELPRRDYGLALLLGILYHLKNPFYVLETLASRADWCYLSTRIAQVTPGGRSRIEDEPVAYLLGAREANNDPTNFWIFSAAGLVRLLERAGWMVVAQSRLGCTEESDPVRGEADERIFLLAKSRVRHPELHVRALDGWYEAEQDAFRWTAKRFALEAALPLSEPAREFALRFFVPEVVAASGPVRLSCSIRGEAAGAIHCGSAEELEFRGRFPAGTDAGATVRLDFTVESLFRAAGDDRELGVCVPLLDAGQRHLQRIPFRIS